MVDVEPEGENGVITAMHERKNYIVRKSINLSKKTHVLASNIDHVFVLATVSNPRTPYGFIDRMLVTAEAYSIPVSIIFNKKDEWKEKDIELAEEMIFTYQHCGFRTFTISALNPDDVDSIRSVFANQTNLLIGHSGTGKSTLINALNPLLNIKTAATSLAHLQGKHTTTFAEMHNIGVNTFIVDTPGIREFGLINMNKSELGHYFPEIRALMNKCKFNNCIHQNEPGCAVKEAVEQLEIPYTRYRSYLSMLEGETEAEFD